MAMVCFRDNALSEIVNFLKIDASTNCEFPGAPEIFQSGFGRPPTPPNTDARGTCLGEFARHHRTMIAHPLTHAIENVLGIVAQTSYPVLTLGNILT